MTLENIVYQNGTKLEPVIYHGKDNKRVSVMNPLTLLCPKEYKLADKFSSLEKEKSFEITMNFPVMGVLSVDLSFKFGVRFGLYASIGPAFDQLTGMEGCQL